jgi:ATP-binding cassette subfamily B protein
LNATVYGEFQTRISGLGNLQNKFGWVSEVSGVFFLMGVFGLSSWLVLNKELKLGEMVALLGMAGSIVPSLNRLIVSNIQIQEALVAFDRMFEFTSMQKEEGDGAEIKEGIEEVKLNRVSFRFPGRKQILSDVSFSIRKGEMIALKGESGSGKSTLMQLLQKFYQPESGTIEVNGQNLENLNTNEWRKRLGCVPQEVKIFNGHLLYNITLSHDSEKFEKATAFCERVGFTKYFHEFPQGYLTLLGEEGINISGGQKQLVGLARALFSNPQVLLLDEATSAMDKKTEDFVLRLLFALKPEIAVLFVTHRKDTAEYCDRIVKLDSGKLVE